MKLEKEYTAAVHLKLCLEEKQDYSIGRAHCRLASLYPDYNSAVADLTELQFYIKWERTLEAASVLERIVKSPPSDEGWELILQLFSKASSSENSTEKALFAEISSDTFECIIGALTKRYDNVDDLLKTKLLLFCLRNGDENKFGKLLNRAVTFMTERANNDKEYINGVGRYHVYLAVIVAPALLKLNLTNIAVNRALSVVITVLHVGIAWSEHFNIWMGYLESVLENYALEAYQFAEQRFKIAAALFDKCVHLYDLGAPINLLSNMNGCGALLNVVEKAYSLKSEARKIAFPFFVWYAYGIWKANVNEDEMLVWSPENNWVMDVDKLINSNAEAVSPSKKLRLKERKEESSTGYTDYLLSSRRELCDAYELCGTAFCTYVTSICATTVAENLYFVAFFEDVQLLIEESLLYKCKLNEMISYVNDLLLCEVLEREVLHFHLVCAHCLNQNWSDAFENVVTILSILGSSNNYKVFGNTVPLKKLKSKFKMHASSALMTRYPSVDDRNSQTELQLAFNVVKKDQLRILVYDLAYHILFRVYTSTTMDHENDQLLGALLVMSQINFATRGYKCFNRIMRYVEAKGSLKSAGLVKYIRDIAILEELSRIQDYCTEYVSVQIAVPQVQRRIGQSTRHSVRGTINGQKQSVEEQMKMCHQDAHVTVSSYLVENKEAILRMLGAKF